jgi:hypothetical protein
MRDLTKENLEVRQFNLKQIVENLDKIPRNGKPFGDERQKLTPQQKKHLMELIGKYNEYGKSLQCEQALMETAKVMEEISGLAETYALTESEDWMHGKIVERDFKQLKSIAKEYKKLTQECYGHLQQMAALFEDSGVILERYYKINSLDESNINNEIPPQVAANTPIIKRNAEEEENVSV